MFYNVSLRVTGKQSTSSAPTEWNDKPFFFSAGRISPFLLCHLLISQHVSLCCTILRIGIQVFLIYFCSIFITL